MLKDAKGRSWTLAKFCHATLMDARTLMGAFGRSRTLFDAKGRFLTLIGTLWHSWTIGRSWSLMDGESLKNPHRRSLTLVDVLRRFFTRRSRSRFQIKRNTLFKKLEKLSTPTVRVFNTNFVWLAWYFLRKIYDLLRYHTARYG